jgi:hypothetical protein
MAMAVEMINQWFGIEEMGERFLVRDLAGVHANCATRDEAIAWIEAEMAKIAEQGQDEPEASADEYLES